MSRHWLFVANLFCGVYLLGAVAAPTLMAARMPRAAHALYSFYKPFCHQFAFRTWFLYGERAAYPLNEPLSLIEMSEASQFLGTPEMGYKMALCQRDLAIYGVMLIGGILFTWYRKARATNPLSLWIFFVFCVLPMLLDGGVQWLSYAVWHFAPSLLSQPFETIPLMRTITGALFGFGIVAVLYPYLQEYFEEVASPAILGYTSEHTNQRQRNQKGNNHDAAN